MPPTAALAQTLRLLHVPEATHREWLAAPDTPVAMRLALHVPMNSLARMGTHLDGLVVDGTTWYLNRARTAANTRAHSETQRVAELFRRAGAEAVTIASHLTATSPGFLATLPPNTLIALRHTLGPTLDTASAP